MLQDCYIHNWIWKFNKKSRKGGIQVVSIQRVKNIQEAIGNQPSMLKDLSNTLKSWSKWNSTFNDWETHDFLCDFISKG